MENGIKRRMSDDEGILIEFNNPQKRVRHEMVEYEHNDKNGTIMEVEVSLII